LGTTHNIAGTHRCLDLDTLLEKTGDIFRPALLTTSAINRLSQLAGVLPTNLAIAPIVEPLLDNPTAPYALDPDRGVLEEFPLVMESPPTNADIVNLDSTLTDLAQESQEPNDDAQGLHAPSDLLYDPQIETIIPDRTISQA
jgi:hypothetical protein